MEKKTKKCPYCGKEILAVAKKCKHCRQWIAKPVIGYNGATTTENTNHPKRSHAWVGCLGLVIVVIAAYFAVSQCSNSSSEPMATDYYDEAELVPEAVVEVDTVVVDYDDYSY